MKRLFALFCAALILYPCTFFTSARAEGVYAAAPQQTPAAQKTQLNKAKLQEAKAILQKINQELQKTPAPTQTAAAPQNPTPEPQNESQSFEEDYKKIEELLVSRQGDIELECGPLGEEALNMRDLIYTTQEIKNRAKMQSHGITAAGAVGSFLIGSVTGGVGLAVGGFLLDQNVNKAKNDADRIQDMAEQRRMLMVGIFQAKSCYGPIEHALQNPEIFDPLSSIAVAEPAAGEPDTESYNN